MPGPVLTAISTETHHQTALEGLTAASVPIDSRFHMRRCTDPPDALGAATKQERMAIPIRRPYACGAVIEDSGEEQQKSLSPSGRRCCFT